MTDLKKSRGVVFLSYGHDPVSTPLVKQIANDLCALGWRPWLDESKIKFSDDWRREITKGIHESDHVLAFLSRHSTRKPGVCRQEIAIAIGPKKGHVYTVLLESPEYVTPPLILSHLQWLDMQEWESKQQTDPEAAREFYRLKFQQIVEVLERNEPFAGEIEALRHWLDPWDGTADQVAAEQGFTGRRWLLDGLVQPTWWNEYDGVDEELTPGEIERWRASLIGGRVFWIAAEPGWGKSAVAARLAHAARAHVLAVHFCRHDQPQTCDARKVVRTIAFQMATQLGDYRELLVRLSKQGLALQELNAKELFTRLLTNPLTFEVGGDREKEGRRLIVLDALDETLENGHSELVDLISTEFGKLPAWLGLLVTSRREVPIELQLQQFGVHYQHENDPRNESDLRAYTQVWLQTLPLEPIQREVALNALVWASAGMFLYMSKLKEAVANQIIKPDALTQPESLPKGLGALYLLWFKHRFQDKFNYAEYEERQLPLFDVMLCAREPLPLSLASLLLNWGARGQYKALEPLGSLCRLESDQLSFFHKSLSEWLSKPSDSGPFHASNKEGHRVMAKGLWHAYDRWRAAGAYLADDIGWSALGKMGDAYAMRHLPAHLSSAGLRDEWRMALADFALAMRRCVAYAHEALIDDHLAVDSGQFDAELEEWKFTLQAEGHLLSRNQPWWPPHRLLLQIAMERPISSPLRQSASQWRAINREGWPWLLCERASTGQRSGNRTFIDLSQGRAVDVNMLAVLWSSLHAAVVVSSGDVLVFNLKTGQQVHRLESVGPCSRIYLKEDELECFHPDGTRSLWSLASGRFLLKATLGASGTQESVERGLMRTSRTGCFDITWDGLSNLVVKAADSSVPEVRHTVPSKAKVKSIAVADNGARCAAGCSDGKVWHWGAVTTQEPLCLQSGNKEIHCIDISPNGQWIATVGADGVLRVWDAHEGSLRFAMTGHSYRATRVCLSPDGRKAVTAGQDGKLILWDLSSISVESSSAEVTALVDLSGVPNSAGQCVASDAAGRVQLYSWEREGLPKLMTWQAHDNKIWDLTKSPDGHYLVTAGADGYARVWHRETSTCLAHIQSPTGKPFRAVAISPDGHWLVIAGEDKRPQVHDLRAALQGQVPKGASRTLKETFLLDCRFPIERLLFVDETHVLSADNAGTVRCWRLGTPGYLWKIDHGDACERSPGQPKYGSNQKGTYAMAISRSGRYLACSGRGIHRGISIWELGEALHKVPPVLQHVLHGHERGVHFIAFRDDDRHLISASWDENIVMWDWRQCQQLLLRPVPQLSAVQIVSEGDRLAVGTGLGDLLTLSFQNIPGPTHA